MANKFSLFIGLLLFLLLPSCEMANAEKKSFTSNEQNQTNLKQKKEFLPEQDAQELLIEEFGPYSEKGNNKELINAYNKTLKLWNIPFQEVNVVTKKGYAHVIACGPKNGEVIVLLHGLNATSTMWYPNIKALSENYRVYAIDYPLEPGKIKPNETFENMDEVVDWHVDVINQLKIDEFHLVGASRGGWLATDIALHEKERLKNLVLISPAQTFSWIPPGSGMLKNVDYSLLPNRRKLRNVLETLSYNVDGIKQAFINQYYLATEKTSVGKFILQMTPYADNDLESIKIPVLLLIGDNDIINNQKSVAKAEKLLSNVQTKTIKNAGHFVSFDQAKTVNDLILKFIK